METQMNDQQIQQQIKNISSKLESKLKIFTLQAQQYQQKIEHAKTDFKKVFYKKKLDKITNKVVEILLQIKNLKGGV